jgi:hypothetical protein
MHKKYIGVHKRRTSGRMYFRVSFSYKGTKHEFGHYTDEKECAKAYDMLVIKMGYDRKTNFFKKKLQDNQI